MNQRTTFDVCKAIVVSYYDIVVEKLKGLGRFNNTPCPKVTMATSKELKELYPSGYSEDRVVYYGDGGLVIDSDVIGTASIRVVCNNIAAWLIMICDEVDRKITSGDYTQPVPYRIGLTDEEQKNEGLVDSARWIYLVTDPVHAMCIKLFPEVIGDPSPKEVADANRIIPIETIFPQQWVEYLFDGRQPNVDYGGDAWLIMSPVFNKWNSGMLISHTSLQKIVNGEVPSTWTELDRGWEIRGVTFAVPADGYSNKDVIELFKRAAKASAPWVEAHEKGVIHA